MTPAHHVATGRGHLPRPVVAVLLTAALLVAVPGCAPSGTESPGEGGSTQDVAAAARAAGADESQLAILEDGAVTYAEYEAAMNRSFECMRDRGFQVDVHGTTTANGVTLLDYQVSGTSTETDLDADTGRALLEECHTEFSGAVDSFWQVSSPDAIAFAERRDAAVGPLMRACLEEHDVDLADDATMLDLIHQATDLQNRDETADCITESGYTTWQG